jgi:GntR family transcriptional regulator
MDRPVNSDSPTFSPLYQQIRELMMRSLESDEWGPGQVIPTELELAKRYGVSQGTVRKAIDELVALHLLVRRQGKGTYVAAHDDASAFRFLRVRANEGGRQAVSRIPLECRRAKAGAAVARNLGIEIGAPIVIVRRLLRFGGEPIVLDEIYLPGVLFSDLTLDILKESDLPLYTLFESRYGVRMIRAEERLSAVVADRISAEFLEVSEGSPLLLVERVAYGYGDRPAEWRRGFYLTRNFHYHNELA